ncbi:peptidylprolyl isomerase [Granulicella sp. WH15]|uniref:peptidylprolyl isomerase n=1 Tax=Granulicella sp. WH15 TaxID=2602070 RepID=UPI0013674D90|nr:peptidylprolyl isomerase [Granulicella sp. WH15]QHN05563.1 peptidylprolyl isomerase [Granulicella sp. WH15]
MKLPAVVVGRSEKRQWVSGFAAWSLMAALAVPVSALVAGSAAAQVVQAPRYQSSQSVNAPTQQLKMPPLPPAITPGGTVVEDVVARVNDQIINRSDLERSQQQLEMELAQQNASPSEAANRQRDMLRDMIDQQLLISRGKELGINADAEVIRRLDEIRKQNKMDSMEQLEAAAKQQGVSFEDFKAQIRNSVVTQQVVRDEVGRRLQMTQAQEQAYYDQHKSEFSQPEQIRLSEILVPLPADAAPDAVAQAQAKANDIKSKITAGGKFDELAKQYSGGPTAAQGGELGLFKRGALAKVLEDQTFDLKAGESTQPIRTRQGFVILNVTEHQAAGVAPLKEVEQQVQEAMYMQQMQPALRAYLTKLREEAYIDIKPGFVDSGASPKETKPIFTSYAPPTPKKKKVTEKKRFERASGFSRPAAKPVVAGPDTTGGRTLTGAEAQQAQAAAAPTVDPKTGLAVIAPPKLAANGKPKKVRREKVRFGQAPQNSLPAETAQQAAAEAASPAPAGGGIGAAIAPGAVMADAASSPDSSSQVAADVGDDPLAPKAPEKKKTRYGSRENAAKVKTEKIKKVKAKKVEKVKAAPVEMTSDEKAASQTQAAPLGLNGDTAKPKKVKVKKPKRKKGDPKPVKERLQGKQKVVPPPPAEPAPTANPALAPRGDVPATPSPVPATPPQI